MRFKMYTILAVYCIITPIWAAFKDFVKENEKDVQFSGVSNDETVSYDSLNVELYDDEFHNAIGRKCDGYGDLSDRYDMFERIGENDIDIVGIPAGGEYIDEDILSDVIQQLADHPSFHQLEKHLGKADSAGRDNQDLLTQDYMDYYENYEY